MSEEKTADKRQEEAEVKGKTGERGYVSICNRSLVGRRIGHKVGSVSYVNCLNTS